MANPNFVERYLNPSIFPVINNEDGSVSTHRMASGEANGKYIAYPTIIQRKDGELEELSLEDAAKYALENKEYMEFDTNLEATRYAENGYKKDWAKGDYDKAHAEQRFQDAFDIKITAQPLD